MQVATIKLTGPDFKKLDGVCSQIKDICQKTGAKVSGPVPLPTKKLKLPVRKSPCGDGSETFQVSCVKLPSSSVNDPGDPVIDGG